MGKNIARKQGAEKRRIDQAVAARTKELQRKLDAALSDKAAYQEEKASIPSGIVEAQEHGPKWYASDVATDHGCSAEDWCRIVGGQIQAAVDSATRSAPGETGRPEQPALSAGERALSILPQNVVRLYTDSSEGQRSSWDADEWRRIVAEAIRGAEVYADLLATLHEQARCAAIARKHESPACEACRRIAEEILAGGQP
jgi:hypothetical protein